MSNRFDVSGMSALRDPGSDRFGPRPQRVWMVRSSVRPEAGRRQAQRDTPSEWSLRNERGH
jgi:hypothetical protein